jgi:hypothetical protein
MLVCSNGRPQQSIIEEGANMNDTTNRVTKKGRKSLPVKSFFVVVLMLLFFMLISCTYTPNWKFTFDESENEDQAQEMALGQVT